MNNQSTKQPWTTKDYVGLWVAYTLVVWIALFIYGYHSATQSTGISPGLDAFIGATALTFIAQALPVAILVFFMLTAAVRFGSQVQSDAEGFRDDRVRRSVGVYRRQCPVCMVAVNEHNQCPYCGV